MTTSAFDKAGGDAGRRAPPGRWRRNTSGRRDEADPEHDGQHGRHHPAGVGLELGDGCGERSAAHQDPSVGMTASTSSVDGSCSSPASPPSASSTTRSAYDGGDRVVGDHDDRLARVSRTDRAGSQQRPRRRTGSPGRRSARRRRPPRGRVTSARAIATRCCWPPDSSLGRCRSRSARPSDPVSGSNRPRSARRPASSSGSRMFCSAVSVGSRLNDWKTKPTRSRRSGGQRPVVQRR